MNSYIDGDDAFPQPVDGVPAASRPERRKRVIVVAGMHRSGTSALSGVCHLLGVDVPGELLEPAFDNPKGFFENKRIVALDDDILRQLGSTYDEPVSIGADRFRALEESGAVDRLADLLAAELGGANLCLIKDPRICRLVPAYVSALRSIGREPLIAHCLRHPVEVARSLRKRNEFPEAHGLLLWLDHVLSAEAYSRDAARSFVFYDELMADWRSSTTRMAGDLSIVWPRDPERAEATIAEFLSSDLRHHRNENGFSRSPSELESLCEAAWSHLHDLASDPRHAGAMDGLDRLRATLASGERLYGGYAIASQRLLEQRRDRITDLEEHSAHMNHLLEREAEKVVHAHARLADHEALVERLHVSNTEIGRLHREIGRIDAARAEAVATLHAAASAAAEEVSLLQGEMSVRQEAFEADLEALREQHDATLTAHREASHLLSEHVDALRHQHDVMRASASWRLSAPLRIASRRLPGPVKRVAKGSLRAVRSWFRSGAAMPVTPSEPVAPVAVDVAEAPTLLPIEAPPLEVAADGSGDLTPLEIDIVDVVTRSGRFDADAYRRLHDVEADDALLHYVLEGERLGYRPTDTFDPRYYALKYPDVAASGMNLFYHFLLSGESEGRSGVPAGRSIAFQPLDARADARTVIVIAHEASRTGAPILAWNIAKHVHRTDNVLTLLVKGGEFAPSFADVSDVVLGPLPDGTYFDPFEAEFVVADILERYRIDYVIANSVETRNFAVAFAQKGVPVVSLVHEFSTYYRPPGLLHSLYDWSSRIVFPAQVVRAMSESEYEVLRARRSEIIPQGQSEVPALGPASLAEEDASAVLEMPDFLARVEDGAFLVVGMGTVQQRKGVDLFIAAAAAARAAAPDARLRFVWIGHGYEPDHDLQYSVYLQAQIMMSGLGDALEIVEPIRDLAPVYERMDALLLTSRLDPLPNVSIDAALAGTPVVCFAGASGMADILAENAATAPLVAPHLDSTRAGEAIVRLAGDAVFRAEASAAIRTIAERRFDMAGYIEQLRRLGEEAIAEERQLEADAQRLAEDEDAFDPTYYVGADLQAMTRVEAIRHYLRRSRHRDNRPASYAYSRRPIPGFNPDRYAQAQPAEPLQADPLVRFLQAERPAGPWVHAVLRPGESEGAAEPLRTLLHGHFHYPDLLPDLLERLRANETRCDLALTTDTDEKAAELAAGAAGWDRGTVAVEVVPNRGRDIGPFLSTLRDRLGSYDLVGHLHGKKSRRLDAIDATYGERWREFLWAHLVSDAQAPMLDRIAAAFAARPDLGLVFADDPNMVGWDGSRGFAEDLARRMGLPEALPDSFDFPNGTMFWARPAALRPLLDLGLTFDDYPGEPLADDGTLLHAIERILPFVAEGAGFAVASTHVPGALR